MNYLSSGYEKDVYPLPFEFVHRYRKREYYPDVQGGYYVPQDIAFWLLCFIEPQYEGEC